MVTTAGLLGVGMDSFVQPYSNGVRKLPLMRFSCFGKVSGLLHGAGSAAGCCRDSCRGQHVNMLSSAANASYSIYAIVFSSKHHHPNLRSAAVGFAANKNWCFKNDVYRSRQWQELQHRFGKSDSRVGTGRRENSRDCSATGILPVRFYASVVGKGDLGAGEGVFDSQVERGIYQTFADFAVGELGKRSDASPLLLKEEFRNMVARDGSTTIENKAFSASKIRYFRSTYINASPSMEVLNVAGFARPEYDIPIFCADFFSTPTRNIIVLDLNPLYNTSTNRLYKERYYDDLMALANRHAQVLPWGDKLTAESIQFFSPLVLWTKAQGQDLNKTLYPAFQDYLLAWFGILDKSQPSMDAVAIARNQEAQHRYLTWRATKDPGRPLLARLYGEEFAERFIEEVLFHGVKSFGTKSFLDYFPEYRTENNTISKQRSMIGKSYSTRPWDEHGNVCLS